MLIMMENKKSFMALQRSIMMEHCCIVLQIFCRKEVPIREQKPGLVMVMHFMLPILIRIVMGWKYTRFLRELHRLHTVMHCVTQKRERLFLANIQVKTPDEV